MAAEDDPDGDGFTNLFESVTGTDPHDSDSFLDLALEIVPEGLALTWDEQAGKQYVIESSEDLLVWTEVDTLEPADLPPPASGTPPPANSYDVLDNWHPWGAGYLGFDDFWTWAYGFEANSGTTGYGFSDDLDGDGQPNFVESFANTNPEEALGLFRPLLDVGRSRLRFEWYGNDGNLRYHLEFAVVFTAYSPSTVSGTEFEPHAAGLDPNFSGAVANHATDPSELGTHLAGGEHVRRSDGYSPPDENVAPDVVDHSEATFLDGGDGYLIISWPETATRGAYAVKARALIGDWYFGKNYSLETTEPPSGSGDPTPGARKFYRITASDATVTGTSMTYWEHHVLAVDHPDADWDLDGVSNADEASAKTNPTTADTDGDGFGDEYESSAGADPNDPASTPPAARPTVGRPPDHRLRLLDSPRA